MSNPDQPVPQAPEAAPVKPKGLSSSDLNTRIADLVTTNAPKRVLDKVVEVLVDKEVDKRAQALLGGLELANQTRAALRKAEEPDVRPQLFSRDNKPIGEPGWSKPRLAEIKKLTEKLAKIEKAIDAATRDDKPDFSLLYNLKSDIEKAEKAAEQPVE